MGNCYFFYCDSDETTKKKITGGRSIPERPLKLLANILLWPIGVNGYWVNVPTKRQAESECGV
jgi:hypothetical protein